VMDGYEVSTMAAAAKVGDIFVTVTGNRHVIDVHHFEAMKDGALVANSGHFDVEVNVAGLRELAREVREVRPGGDEYRLPSGRRIRLLAQGRLVNLACAEGHPAQVMDMSFANQALVVRWLWVERPKLERKVYSVPREIDQEVARRKLNSLGIEIDTLTPEQ